MATHSITKFRLTKSINKEQLKLLKQQLHDSNHHDSQTNNSQQNQNNLTQQLQNLNSQTLTFNSIFNEIQQQQPFSYTQNCTYLTQNFDLSLNIILRKLSIQNQYEINKRIKSQRKHTQPINNTNEGTIKEDQEF
ncbi:unnamed protein product [Paramecium pentaurelia]|uniref:Uncharacterized protein n=1 Tax=Paramecium pentaurelia TaxID=43138 RepID=A0A8S1USI9_9CILI|nr:unnamed protein product [Paramecium pentaurelia]